MLRPATPLTILLFISFVLLLLSVITTPVVKGIPLATFQGVNYGVFGYCKGSKCSGIRVGYTTNGVFGSSDDDGDFSLPSSARHSLSSLLIVHPVAALLNLVCLGLAGSAHLHSPSHSPRYLLGLLILLLPTLLVTLLAFLVDILLFVPHLAWGGWIVLASTILLTVAAVVTCAMRRTLVSRKARKKRIAENAEMSGENFYGRQNSLPKAESPPPMMGDSNPPMVHGAPGSNALPAFATYEPGRKLSDEERIPLNDRTPSTRAPGSAPSSRDDGSERYGAPGTRGRGYGGPRDEFGNPLPSSAAFGPSQIRRDPSEPRMRPSMDGSQRGSFGSRGRGGYPTPRGSYRGGAGPRGPPPPGFNARGRGPPGRGGMGPMMAGAGAGMAAGAMMGRGGRGPPPGYQGREMSPGGYGSPAGYPRRPGPDMSPVGYGSPSGYPRRPGPDFAPPTAFAPSQELGPVLPVNIQGPVGQAVEMDASTGSSSHPPSGYGPPENRVRESDDDVQGMVGLQQNRQAELAQSPTSMYSPAGEYIPPRQAWGGGALTRLGGSPVELPTAQSAVGAPGRKRVDSGDNYYEDVDPRFVHEEQSAFPSSSVLPPTLQTGPPQGLRPSNSYEEMHEGARSPAASEASHFTSVSQRGVNPNWGPPPDMPMRRPVQHRRDVLLGNNPDFELPGASPTGRGGRGGGRGRIPGQIPSMGGGGRYPGAEI